MSDQTPRDALAEALDGDQAEYREKAEEQAELAARAERLKAEIERLEAKQDAAAAAKKAAKEATEERSAVEALAHTIHKARTLTLPCPDNYAEDLDAWCWEAARIVIAAGWVSPQIYALAMLDERKARAEAIRRRGTSESTC